MEKQSSLETTLTCSDKELKTDIANFENLMNERKNELQLLQNNMHDLTSIISKQRQSIDTMNIKHGQGVMLLEQISQLKDEQMQLGSSLVRKYNLPTALSSNSNNSSNAGSNSSSITEWTPAVVRTFLMNLNNEVRVVGFYLGFHIDFLG